MSEEIISSLCERFVNRLRDNSSRNYTRHRFFPNGTAKEILRSNKQDLRELFEHVCQIHSIPPTLLSKIVDKTLKDLSTVFAILLWVRGRHEIRVLRQFLNLIPETRSDDVVTPLVTDEDLPISNSDATNIFPLQGNEFHEEQFQFCAVTLRKRELAIYKDDRLSCPLPYLEEQVIGQGAFGQVWKVRIERRHIQSHVDETKEAMEYARKDFEMSGERAFEEERKILKKILDQPQRHMNIMVALASLQYGNKYSLFFELASCNLWEYMTGVRAEDPHPPSDWDQKCKIYLHAVKLAGALAFLHNEFRNERLEILSCYHLDLKPHNILVCDAYTPSERWKITDFGLSRVKGRAVDGEPDVGLVMPFLDRVQRGTRTKNLREPSTMNRRGEGTYMAPECNLTHGRVSSASDVWSFGCIISDIMSYIDSGPSGVLEFGQQRRKQEEGNFFYIVRRGKPRLAKTVIDWFVQLKHKAKSSPHKMEHKVVCLTLDFLQKKVLDPQHDQRVSSKKVEEELTYISQMFHRRPSDVSRGSRQPIFHRFQRTKAHPSYIPLPIDTSIATHGSTFAPEADLLAFHSPEKIQVFFPDEIVSAVEQHRPIPEPKIIPVPLGSWECVASSSRFLCACVAAPFFECYFYNIIPASESSITGISDGTRISYPHLGSIKKAVLSSDGLLAAFVITRQHNGLDSDYILYLSYTQDMVDPRNDGYNRSSSPPSSRSNSAVSSHGTGSTNSSGNLILGESQIGPVEQIRSLIFSSNSQYLILVAQPDPTHLSIRAWETYHGTCCANTRISFSGSSTVGDSLYTACAVFNHVPSLFILSQRKYLLNIVSWCWDHQVHNLPNHLHNIFVRDDDAELIILGDNGNNRLLRAYSLPIPVSKQPELKPIAQSNLTSYQPALDSAILSRTTRGKTRLLVATAKGKFLAINLPEAS